MILVLLISLLFVGGVLAWLAEALDPHLPRAVAMGSVLLTLLVMLFLLGAEPDAGGWLAAVDVPWLPRFGISFYLAVDGLSLLLLLLTGFLGAIAVASAWDEITERPGFFCFNLLWTLAGVLGVFLALDLFLFFFFWEVMLIPMYFIIAIWGHENKNYAAMKFFIFTQVSGLLMLVSILVLAYFHFVQFRGHQFPLPGSAGGDFRWLNRNVGHARFLYRLHHQAAQCAVSLLAAGCPQPRLRPPAV